MKKEDKDKVIKDTGQKVDSMENQQANDISDGVKEFYKFCLDIISKKMNITVQRYKDYMQILRIHVRDYTGEEQGGGEGVGSGSGSSNTMPEEDQKALEELFKNGKAMVQDSEDKNKVHNWTMALERNSNETDYKKLTKKITKLGLKELAGNDTALGSLPVRDFFEQKISKETVAIASAKTGNQIAIVVKSGDATNAYLVDSEADITKIVTTIKKSGVNDQTNIISKMHLQASSKNNDNNNAAENKGNEENKPAENNNEGNK
jgi:hypothetical protein